MTLSSSDWLAIWLSFKVAFFCVLLILIPGIAMGWLLARKHFPGKSLLEALVYAPLVLPPVVTGYFLLLAFGRAGPFGRWLEGLLGFPIAFHLAGAVLAAAVMSFPLLVRSVRLAMELIDAKLEVAAATLGASRIDVFRSITLPLAAPGILTGLTLSFLRGLGEFGATITLAGNIEGETRTMPLAVYTHLQTADGESAVLALGLMALFLSLGALILSEWSSKRMHLRVSGPR